MTELLLETTTEVCSVALARDGRIIASHDEMQAHQHASRLTIFIRDVVRRAGVKLTDLDRIVLSDGPGSFTGLRVGAATAKGLCVALPGLALATVPTLDALAAACGHPRNHVLATLNSRRGEVYGRLYGPGGDPLTEVMNVRLTEPDWQSTTLGRHRVDRLVVTGPGQERVRKIGEPSGAVSFLSPTHCAAGNLLAPASAPKTVDPASYEPFYLNPPFVTKAKPSKLL